MLISAGKTGLAAQCDFFDCAFANSCYSHANYQQSAGRTGRNTASGHATRVRATDMRCDLKARLKQKNF